MLALVYLITTVYFWKISKDWAPYFCINLVLNLIGIVGSLWLPESPRMLLQLGRESEAITVLDRIASFNGYKLTLKNGEISPMMINNSIETSCNTT